MESLSAVPGTLLQFLARELTGGLLPQGQAPPGSEFEGRPVPADTFLALLGQTAATDVGLNLPAGGKKLPIAASADVAAATVPPLAADPALERPAGLALATLTPAPDASGASPATGDGVTPARPVLARFSSPAVSSAVGSGQAESSQGLQRLPARTDGPGKQAPAAPAQGGVAVETGLFKQPVQRPASQSGELPAQRYPDPAAAVPPPLDDQVLQSRSSRSSALGADDALTERLPPPTSENLRASSGRSASEQGPLSAGVAAIRDSLKGRDGDGVPGRLSAGLRELPVASTAVAAQPGSQQAAAAEFESTPATAKFQRLSEAVAGRIQWMLQRDTGEARLRLDPPELGSIEIRLSVRDDKAVVQLTAYNATTRDALEGSLPRLRELLADVGLNLAGATVSDHRQSSSRPRPDDSDFHPLPGAAESELAVSERARPTIGAGRVDLYA
jgi:hypothetical protein